MGVYRSHFEMYLDAMLEVGADTNSIETFLSDITGMDTVLDSTKTSGLHESVKSFLQFTFETIKSGEVHKIAAAFTFGREELIPHMFLRIVDKTAVDGEGSFPKMEYYLRRHIELDGDDHGPLSVKMIKELCGSDTLKWTEVLEVSQKALRCRIHLWDHITEQIVVQKQTIKA